MNDIEQKALIERLRQRSNSNYMLMSHPPKPAPDRDCHAAADLLEQLLPIAQEFSDFRQEVSDALLIYSPENRNPALGRFIIIKPDPLAEMLEKDFGGFMPDAEDFRAALEARGLEIREKNDDQ